MRLPRSWTAFTVGISSSIVNVTSSPVRPVSTAIFTKSAPASISAIAACRSSSPESTKTTNGGNLSRRASQVPAAMIVGASTPPPCVSRRRRVRRHREGGSRSRLFALPADCPDERLDRYRRERFDLDGAPRAETHGDPRDRLVVFRLHDVDEVVTAKRRVLRDHSRAHGLDLFVDL